MDAGVAAVSGPSATLTTELDLYMAALENVDALTSLTQGMHR